MRIKTLQNRLKQTSKSFLVFEELIEEMNIEHQGAFTDLDMNIVFIKLPKIAQFELENCAEELGVRWSNALKMMGVLTDIGAYDKSKGGWVYFDLTEIKEYKP